MKENHLITAKTGRYYTLGELNQNTKQVWFVIHGFGQLAKNFLRDFEPLLSSNVFFIAPEALNHFYLKGSGGEVGATWMTKEDRLNEIKDYTNYLNEVYEQFDLEQYPNLKITALGFSQGASTVTRWVNTSPHRIDTLLVYAGEVGAEVFPVTEKSGVRKTVNYYICGTGDEFFTPDIVKQMKTLYADMNFMEYIEFDGKHVIDTETLKRFIP